MINALQNIFMFCLACNDTPFFWFHVGLKMVQDKLDHFQKTGFKHVDHKDCLFFCMGFAANRQYTLINTASTRSPLNGVCLVTHTVQREGRGVNPNCIFFTWNTKRPKRLQGSSFLSSTKENLSFIMCKKLGKDLWQFMTTFKVYKDLYGKPFKHDSVARVLFPKQVLQIFGSCCNCCFWGIWLNIYRLPNFNTLFQFLLTKLFKSELFSCL